jgi:Fe-S-cluster containining protein
VTTISINDTDAITQTLAGYLDGATPREFAHIVEQYQHVRDSMAGAQSRMSSADHAATTYLALDQAVTEAAQRDPVAKDVKCGAGCAHCCHIAVGVTRAEAPVIRAAARAAGVKLDAATLRLQAKHHDTWDQLPFELRRCAMLGADNHCRIYAHRPTSCRKYHVVTDPADCDTLMRNGARVGIWVCVEAEIVASAAATVWGRISLPEALLGPARKVR